MPRTKFRGYISRIDYAVRAAYFTMIAIADVPTRIQFTVPERATFSINI